MANVIKVDMKNTPAGISEMHVRVEDLSRNILYSGLVPAGNEINLGSVGSVGQGVLIHADNYVSGNENTFMATHGYAIIEDFIEDLVYKMSLPLDGDSLPAQTVLPTKVIMLGASNSDGVVSSNTEYVSALLKMNGIDNVEVVDASVGGRVVSQIYNDGWLPIKDLYTGDASTYVVMTDTLGNSISSLRPYATASTANIESVRSDLQTLITDISNNGNTPLLFETTFRNYINNDVASIDDESLSSLPFQQDILYPIVQSMLPNQWSTTLSRPWFSLYNHTYNLSKLIHNADGIHHTPVGYELLRRLEVDLISRFAKGEPSIVFDQFTPSESNGANASPKSLILEFTSTKSTGPSSTMPFANYFNHLNDHTDRELVPLEGYNPSSITISSIGSGLTHSATNPEFTDDGLNPVDLTHWRIKQAYGYVKDDVPFELFTLKGFNPNQVVSIGMASYKYGATEDRISQFTFNGGVTSQTNGKQDDPNNVVYVDVAADENGEISVIMQRITGSVGQWNGCHVIV